MKTLKTLTQQVSIGIMAGLFEFIELCLSKLMSQGPQFFIFFMLFPLYFAPELVAQLADEHGLYMIAQPQFTHWTEMSLRFSIAVILGLSGFSILGHPSTYRWAMSEAGSCPPKTKNQSHLDDETKKHHQTSTLEYQRTIFALRAMTDAAYLYNHSTPVWKAQQELRDAACQLSDNNITLPHFEALDRYLGGIVDAAKWSIDNTSHEFRFTHGFETADSLAEARGQRPIIRPDAPLAKEACQ